MHQALLEVAVRGPGDVAGADEGGADRLHLAGEGDRSPEPATVSAVCRETELPVFVLLRLNDSWTATWRSTPRSAPTSPGGCPGCPGPSTARSTRPSTRSGPGPGCSTFPGWLRCARPGRHRASGSATTTCL